MLKHEMTNWLSTSKGMASIFILLILSLLSLLTVSLFRTALNNGYGVRNEIAAIQSFYRAQSVASQMASWVSHLEDRQLMTAINDPSKGFPWLVNEKNINLQEVISQSFWNQLTPRKYPPDAQAIAVFLSTVAPQSPAESLLITNDRHIQTCRITILAKAEIGGGNAIVEMGLNKRIYQ
ncbi:MAG: hypothetical protein OMM_03436 [Candidatus Magnetoglobus multicellularis str. Araruama]|uniref:Type IV pilus assembly protein PilX n=1 Tax=Candidatus Magnetoglobus multicellularis str. Araruama TaxID=890399 RepID=A0A1V1P5M3_9BACT|nr:MAG: hypothetical protein OMM_03436 [Candidatus Magnetoglobus multicellularis str. Araruama]